MMEKNRTSGEKNLLPFFFLCKLGESFGRVMKSGEGKKEDASLLVMGWEDACGLYGIDACKHGLHL